MKSLLRKWWFWLLLLLSGIAGWFLYDNWVGAREWAAYADDAHRRGVKLFLAEVPPPPPVPDEQNFAATPLWKAAGESRESLWKIARPLPAVRKPGGLQGPFRPDLAAWRAALLSAGWLAPKDNTGSDAEAVLRGLERYEAPLAELRAGAARPEVRFSTDWRGGVFDASERQLQVVSSVLEPIFLRFECHLSLRQFPEALQDCQDLRSLIRALEASPSLMGHFQTMNTRRTLYLMLAEALEADVWSDDTVRDIEASLARWDSEARFWSALAWERILVNETLERMAQARDAYEILPDGFCERAYTGLQSTRLRWWREGQIAANRGFDQLAGFHGDRGLVQLVAQLHHGTLRTSWIATPLETFTPRRCAYAFKWLVPDLARTRMARVACALTRYRHARGGLPATLAELVPDFLPQVPLDPCTAQPLIYRRTAPGSYLLYSVGLDQTDDGGDSNVNPTTTNGSPDWVWIARQPYSPAKP